MRSNSTAEGDAVKAHELHIDWTRCDGHGSCAELLPEMLTPDEWGYPIAVSGLTVPAELRAHADLAIRACPVVALSLIAVDQRRVTTIREP